MKMKNAMRGLLGCSIVMTVGCASGQMNRADVRQDPAPAAANVAATEYDRPGFVTELDKDGRLWVFREGSPELETYRTSGAPARHVVRPGVGPLGLTLKADNSETIIEYVAVRAGFVAELDKDGRLWVFREGSPELEAYRASGAPARHVVRPGVGPLGLTLKADNSETIIEYVAVRAGFVTELDKDGRLWVFREGSPELEAYRTSGAPARHVVRPGVGPLGLTLKAVELEVLDAYQALL